MLVAKYVKIFSRTGTQSFPFTCRYHIGDSLDLRIAISRVDEQFAAHGVAGASEQRYLMDSNILSSLGRWCALLGSFRAFRKVQHFVDDSKQAISPPQKGKETIKKHTCVESGPPRRFSVRGFRQPGIRCTQQAGKKAKSEISGPYVCLQSEARAAT